MTTTTWPKTTVIVTAVGEVPTAILASISCLALPPTPHRKDRVLWTSAGRFGRAHISTAASDPLYFHIL